MKILHISVPKNGGTFIANNLARNFEPSTRFIVDENNIKLAEFIDKVEDVVSHYHFVAGHIPFRFVSEYASRFDLIVSSYRDPWTRCWSTFQFVTKTQPNWTHLRVTCKEDAAANFERFIDGYFRANRFTRNNQCGYLGEANLPASAIANIDQFGIRMISCDHIESELAELMDELHMSFQKSLPRNASVSDFNLEPGYHPGLDAKILDWFSGDYELYQRLSDRRS
jgi:hypothetical protein